MQLKRLVTTSVVLLSAMVGLAQTGFKPSWATPKKTALAATLQGVWTMTSVGGEALAPSDPSLKIEFRAGNSNVGNYLITRGADEVEAGEFRLTDTPDGLQVDFGPNMGDNAGKIQHGIIKVEGTKLTWCMSPAGSEERPTTFANLTPDAARAAGRVSDGSTVIEALKGEPQKSVAAKPAPSLKESILGTWIVYEKDGVREPDGKYSIVHKFEPQNKWTVYVAGTAKSEGSYSVDENSKPAKLLLVVREKDAKVGKGIHGYVEADGNMLRMSVSMWFDHDIGEDMGNEFKLYRGKAGELTNQLFLLFREGTNPPPPTIANRPQFKAGLLQRPRRVRAKLPAIQWPTCRVNGR